MYEAFHGQKTWRQAELAKRIGIRSERLRTILEALDGSGWPLEREEEPPQVYWSLPRTFFGGGVLLPAALVPSMLRLLAYAPDGRDPVKRSGFAVDRTSDRHPGTRMIDSWCDDILGSA